MVPVQLLCVQQSQIDTHEKVEVLEALEKCSLYVTVQLLYQCLFL